MNYYYALVTTLTNSFHDSYKLSFLDVGTKLKLKVSGGVKNSDTGEDCQWATVRPKDKDLEDIGFVQVCQFGSEDSISDAMTSKIRDNIIEAFSARDLDFLSVIVLRAPEGKWLVQSGRCKKRESKRDDNPYRTAP